jgi:TolB-like protein
MTKQAKPFFEFGPFRLDPAEYRLLRQGEPVPLMPKAFELLLVLVRNRGRLLEKAELMKAVWPDAIVEEANLALNISLLRKALGQSPTGPTYIETVPRRGYRFLADVREVSETTSDCGLRISDLGSNAPPLSRSSSLDSSSSTPTVLAVLPFVVIGEGEQDDYLGLGLADALITRLSNLRQLIVRPTSAVRKLAGSACDPMQAGRELKVESVLEGSIRRAGERIRVTVQLVRVEDESSLWAERFDEQFTDIFAVEDSISEQVARALMLQLNAQEKQRLAKRSTSNAAAYQAYLQGRTYWNKRTEDTLKRSLESFHQAIAHDPGYALAYAGLADAYVVLGSYNYLPPREAFPKATAAAERALLLDEALAEAHASLAHAQLYHEWNWVGAEREYRRAIGLSPNYATGHLWYGLYLTYRGLFDRALDEIRRAQELDLLSLIHHVAEGLVFYYARRYDQTVERCGRALDVDPQFAQAHFWLGMAYERMGRYEQAIAELQTAGALPGSDLVMRAVLGHAYAVAGQRDEAQKILDELAEAGGERSLDPYHLVLIHTGLNATDCAFEWLRKAGDERSALLVRLGVEPKLDGLRSDPRFADLLRRVGLAP